MNSSMSELMAEWAKNEVSRFYAASLSNFEFLSYDFATQYEQKPCGEIWKPGLDGRGVQFESYGGAIDIKTNSITPEDFRYPVILLPPGPSMDEIVLAQPFMSHLPTGIKIKWVAEPLETSFGDEEDLDHWFITPHDLRNSQYEKPIGYSLERSGWSDYEDDL